MIDSNLPRFSQAVQAILLAGAFILDWRIVVPLVGAALLLAVTGGPRWNPFGYVYRALPIPHGEPEPAAPPRFAQLLGTVCLALATAGLFAAEPESTPWWVLGWGPALIVAVLAGLAATTSF